MTDELERKCLELSHRAPTLADRAYWADRAAMYRTRRICQSSMLEGWATATRNH
jgi:hypothetical protein